MRVAKKILAFFILVPEYMFMAFILFFMFMFCILAEIYSWANRQSK